MGELGLLSRFLRWFSSFLWPGDHERDTASVAYEAYLAFNDVARLQDAIENFQLAANQYRKHKNPVLVTTLINLSVAVWARYEDCGQSPADLDTIISATTEALDSWAGDRNTKTYVALLTYLSRTYFELYRMSFEPNLIRPEDREHTFDQAVRFYTELLDNPAATGSEQNTAQIQLGTIFQTRCENEDTLDRLDIGMQYLQKALSSATSAAKEVRVGDEGSAAAQAVVDNIKATCLLNLAKSYETRYILKKNPQNIHDLTMAIDLNTKAKPLLEALDRRELPGCLYTLARQHRSRWLRTRDRSDYDTAKEMAKAAKRDKDLDYDLERPINKLLSLLDRDQFIDVGLGACP